MAERDITRNAARFTALIRNNVFAVIRALANEDFATAAEELGKSAAVSTDTAIPVPDWTPERLREVFDAYVAAHGRIRLDPEARNARHTYVRPIEPEKCWRVEQVLVDTMDQNDWVLEFRVDLARSGTEGRPVMVLARWGPV